ncbi:Oligopeptide ABC transporter, ATP-binding protein OppF (TC 3.A.1.5.1) [Olavius algarvensis Delta 1 endosymbiont]|nr:Oligopeptide ABC transporter, ATP-binding protein OppF (TC 3.A.1.5.1) [Olavius algarvensis Delta 1 endosymbiont]
MSSPGVSPTQTTRAPEDPLVEVRNLKKYFPLTRGLVVRRTTALIKAVDDVSFSIRKGQTLGLVGESGCGKTTTGMCILNLEQPTDGAVYYDGVNLSAMSQRQLIPWRRRIQVIFQDPYSSLNPRMKVGEIIADPMRVHRLCADARQLRGRVAQLLNVCGLPAKMAERYPHELSGGQRQRVGIARALSTDPEFIICDEAVSALDVSIQAQIINLLEDLRQEYDLTYLFISHDLSVVRHLCHRVVVMYLGKMVEMAATDQLFNSPLHPYTRILLASIPLPDPDLEAQRDYSAVKGEIPSPINPPGGCVFHPRCPIAVESCRSRVPALREIMPDHFVACSQV